MKKHDGRIISKRFKKWHADVFEKADEAGDPRRSIQVNYSYPARKRSFFAGWLAAVEYLDADEEDEKAGRHAEG